MGFVPFSFLFEKYLINSAIHMNQQCFLTPSVSCLSNSSTLSSPKAYQRKIVSHLGQNDKSKES